MAVHARPGLKWRALVNQWVRTSDSALSLHVEAIKNVLSALHASKRGPLRKDNPSPPV